MTAYAGKQTFNMGFGPPLALPNYSELIAKFVQEVQINPQAHP
jgi:hypothetical protein